MDFVTGLPLTQRKHDFVWVIVDRLTKSGHFIPVRINYSIDRLAELYVDDIVRLLRCQFCRTETLDLHQDSGRRYNQHWVLVSISVLLFIRREIDSLKD